MIVITLTNAPTSLRGDLTEWLLEISPGVYIGNLSRRVREKLWNRVCSSLKSGQATMVFSTNNEQGFDFYTHGNTWQPRDFEGVKLIYRPFCAPKDSLGEKEFESIEGKRLKVKAIQKKAYSQYAFLDLETTGLNPETDQILEIGIILTDQELAETGRYSWLIKTESVPKAISDLTGITYENCQEDGILLKDVLPKLFDLMENRTIVIHNASFDLAFLSKASEVYGIEMSRFRSIDSIVLAKRKYRRLADYRLETVCDRLDISVQNRHRALADAELVLRIFSRLKESSEKKP